MSGALTGRQWLMVVAGAVVLAVLLNVAWATFGPGDGDSAGDIEAAVERAWDGTATSVDDVSCENGANGWVCRVELSRGQVVDCRVGKPTPQLFDDPKRALGSSCRERRR